MKKKTSYLSFLIMASGISLSTAAQAVPLAGLLTIDAGTKGTDWFVSDPITGDPVPANEGDPGAYTLYQSGSYFAMSPTPDPNVSIMLAPGADGGIQLGSYQNFVLDPDEPHPAGHPDAPFGAGSGYGGTPVVQSGVLQPFPFFSALTYVGINPVGYQSGEAHPAPAVDLDLASCALNVCSITAELSGWEVMWNGTAFEQGPRPDNTGDFILANGSYNQLTNEYSLSWKSQIKGGSFNGVTASWYLEGTHIVPVPPAAILFGSGLLGLLGTAVRRRKKLTQNS